MRIPSLAKAPIRLASVLILGRGSCRFAVLVPLIAGFATAIVGPTGGAQAQGLFEAFFGAAAKKPASRPRYRNLRRGYQVPRQQVFDTYKLQRQKSRAGIRARVYRIRPKEDRAQGQHERDIDMPRQTRRGGYRTVCVRSCDGYYFPVNFAVKRSNFARDAKTCRSKCGEDAKLYIMSTQEKPEQMRDLRGRSYATTKTAFLFRKRRVKACRCRPEPWTSAEKFRHELYELNEPEQRKLARLEGDIDFLSGRTKKRKKLIEAEAAAARLETKLAAMNGVREGANGAPGAARADSSVDRAGAGVDHVAALNWRHSDRWRPGPALAYMSGRDVAGIHIPAGDVTANVTDNVTGGPANNRSRYGNTNRHLANRGWTSRYQINGVPDGPAAPTSYRNRYRNRNRRYRRSGQFVASRRPKPVVRPRTASHRPRKPPAKIYNKSPAGNSFWGLSSKPKYRWPGD